jgi:hypothetical protein
MRKYLLLFAISIMSLALFAQTVQTPFEKSVGYKSQLNLIPLTTAIDFSVTFTDGTPVNLFTTCNAGNSVVLDFFFTTCQYCQLYAPTIDQAFVAHNSGSGNIKFWGIDYQDNNSAVNLYKTTYGVTNPCASGVEGGATAVCSTYSSSFTWSGYPTYSVVCPDHTYNHDVNYPPAATGFNSYFTSCGNSGIADATTPCMITYMYPLPAKDNVNVHVYVDKPSQIKIELIDVLGNCIYSSSSMADKGYYNSAINISNMSAGIYLIRLSQDNDIKDVQKIMVGN